MNEPLQLIDTDVHPAFVRRKDLLPYLPKVWHEQWIETGIGIGDKPYSVVGPSRRDVYPVNGGPPASDPHFLLKDHLDKFGIDYAILVGPNFTLSLSYDPDYANAVTSATNDWLVENWLNVSPKFKASIVINNSDPIAAAKEIDRMGRHPGMVQVIMCSPSSRTLYGQRFYHPIYEAAERNGLPVAIHPGPEGTGTSLPPTPSGYPTRYIEVHNMFALNHLAHINSLVCEGVFEKFSKLKFVSIEGGISWLAHLMWRMDKNYKALRDTVPWLKRLPSEYIREHVRLTTQPIEESEEPGQLAQIIQMLRAEDMIMFSSDYPHWDFDNPEVDIQCL
jgi:predicted TIM-barrel fold metal-dependent hydrolase